MIRLPLLLREPPFPPFPPCWFSSLHTERGLGGEDSPHGLEGAEALDTAGARERANLIGEVTGGEVVAAGLVLQRRLDLAADLLRQRAACVEAAAGWDVDRAG